MMSDARSPRRVPARTANEGVKLTVAFGARRLSAGR
jgi:hypothetical protein